MADGKRKFFHIMLSIPVSIICVLFVFLFDVPNPMMILVLPVIYFTYAGGYLSGFLSCAISILYSLYYFSIPGHLFVYDAAGIKKILTILVSLTVTTLLVGKTKRRADEQRDETARLNNNFLKILSRMDVQLLVTDPNSDKVLFAKAKMNVEYEMDQDPIGQTCWRIFYGLNRRC